MRTDRSDGFSRFAERYLADAGERSVYLALVAEPGRTWRAGSLARELGLSSDEVRAVIAVFERAGVVESWTDDRGPHFAWRSDVRYLFDDRDEGDLPVDPVCQMRVVEHSPHRVKDVFGNEHVFCSAACLETFEASYPPVSPVTSPTRAPAATSE
jgi:YHS domain-containing protein